MEQEISNEPHAQRKLQHKFHVLLGLGDYREVALGKMPHESKPDESNISLHTRCNRTC
jgi:hypothetical protein